MNRILRWIGIVLGVLVGLLVVAYVVLYVLSEQKLNAVYDVTVEPVVIPTDAASIARGAHLVNGLLFCNECHGPDLGGTVMSEDPIVGRLVAPNLTSGQGGAGREFTDEDFIRAIRHGVNPQGRALIVMPAIMFWELSDADLGAVIAYVKSVPPVDKESPDTAIGPLGRFFVLADPTGLSASVIDHDGPRPPAPVPGVTAEYGKYLAVQCRSCHGPDMAGLPEEMGGGSNLTPGGELGTWTEADFINAIRTRVKPNGEEIDPEMAPLFQMIASLTDDELKAIWLYLQSLPPVTNTPTPAS